MPTGKLHFKKRKIKSEIVDIISQQKTLILFDALKSRSNRNIL